MSCGASKLTADAPDQLPFPGIGDLVLLLRLDITLRMDSRLMEAEEALPGFFPDRSGVGAGLAAKGPGARSGLTVLAGKRLPADSCLEVLARRRSCTVIRTLSTACTQSEGSPEDTFCWLTSPLHPHTFVHPYPPNHPHPHTHPRPCAHPGTQAGRQAHTHIMLRL